MRRSSILLAGLVLLSACTRADPKTRLVLAATTTLEDTGLLDTLAVQFAKAHPEIELSPIAVGTGEALALGRRGDADVIISHDSAAEQQLVDSGRAIERRSLMYNDFVIAGPAEDPARIKGHDAVRALKSIAGTNSIFVSRGDDSGTHRKEKKLWKEAGIDPHGDWYIEAAVGMGDALLLAGQKHAYILTDRGTYLRFRSRAGLAVLTEKDARLQNRYGVTIVRGNNEKAARAFADWVTGDTAQKLIGELGRKEFGQSFFVPSANGAALRDTIPTGER